MNIYVLIVYVIKIATETNGDACACALACSYLSHLAYASGRGHHGGYDDGCDVQHDGIHCAHYDDGRGGCGVQHDARHDDVHHA